MIKNIPTNIITGFLGVGKTTAIQHLLKNKPAGERWAVLVNEFGEVGVDASLISGNDTEAANVFIREVPGGCMCCTAGLPMQMALTMLLAKAKPDRLLIEPTGLGHPEEVMGVLRGENHRDVLELCATITLVDARKVADSRYTENETFNQQLAIADVIVANKKDLYTAQELQQLSDFLKNNALSATPLQQVQHGQLDIEWLAQPCNFTGHVHQHDTPESLAISSLPTQPEIPASGMLRIDNQADGFHSSGWLFDNRFKFDYDKLYTHLLGVDADRLKAVFITDKGIFGFNQVDGVMSVMELDETLDSRIEVIGPDPQYWQGLENTIQACLMSR